MDNIYQPTDPSLIEKQNQHWRTKARYDEVQRLYFDLLDLNLERVRLEYVGRWQNQAARVFRLRERDRGDGKYPWVGIDPIYDNKRSHKQVHFLDLSAVLANSPLAIPFNYTGRLIRQGSILYQSRRIPKLALPIPIPAEHARQVMEREWKTVRENWLSRHENGKKQTANLRAYLAEELIYSSTTVIDGAHFDEIINHEYFDLPSPREVGQLLGCIDYFNICWREFHKAEQQATTVPAQSEDKNSSIERFMARIRKIELWLNEQQQLTTQPWGVDEWREEYGAFFLEFSKVIPFLKKKLLRACYVQLMQLQPTLRPAWLLRVNQYEEWGHPFLATNLTDVLTFCEFTPVQPTQQTTNQREECLLAYLHEHLFIKEWYVWQALILLAGALGEPTPETPDSFKPQPPKPKDLETNQISTSSYYPLSGSSTEGSVKEQALVDIHVNESTIPLMWQSLLIGELSVAGFFAFLIKCGLLDAEGKLTGLGRGEGITKARKAPWAGTLQALMQANLLDSNAAAVCRALADPAGRIEVSLNEGTLRELSSKADSYFKIANSHLEELGFLRK